MFLFMFYEDEEKPSKRRVASVDGDLSSASCSRAGSRRIYRRPSMARFVMYLAMDFFDRNTEKQKFMMSLH
eukprot:3035261-Pleurochrysis_carterae.AAC.1